MARAALGHGHEGGVGPGQVVGGERNAGIAVELFGQVAVCWNVLLGKSDEGVGVGGYGIHDLGEWGVGVAAVVLADCDSWVDVLNEGEGGLVYNEAVTGLPLCYGTVEKLCSSSGNEVPLSISYVQCSRELNLPRIATHVRILGISANSNTLALRNASVDSVGSSESINQHLEVGKSLAVAGLDSWAITVRIDIENGNGSQDRVSVETSSAIIDIDV